MEIVKPRTLSGFMELLPEKQVLFDRMTDEIRRVFALYGFAPLDTPVIEAAEILLAKGGGETEKQIYRFSKGGADLALRFDLTVPLAKYVALNYSRLAFPFRRCQIGKVYRGERAQKGRFREFYQADIDVIGDGALDIINEAEIPAIIFNVFNSLGLTGFRVRLNNRKVLTGLFQALGLSGRAGDIMREVDKLEKIGAIKVLDYLTSELGLSGGAAERLLEIIQSGDPFEALSPFRGKNEALDTGIAELETVARHLGGFGVPQTHYSIDLTIARGLDYYTGTVYETVLNDYPSIGSICSGGRYDDLAGYYIDKKLPGVGVSIGLTRLFYVLDEMGLLSDGLNTAPCDALILPMTEDISFAITTATLLRDRGIRVRLYGEGKRFKAKMSHADKLGVPFAVLVGEDEIKSGTVSVKNMRTGIQHRVSPSAAAEMILTETESGKNISPIKEKYSK